MSYVLKREEKKKKVIFFPMPFDGYKMKPKLKNRATLIAIGEITLVKESLKTSFIKIQFNIVYRKLVAILIDVLESEDASSADCMMALNEYTKLESMIKLKFSKDLKREELDKFRKKIAILENKMQKKLIEIRSKELVEEMKHVPDRTENIGKSR